MNYKELDKLIIETMQEHFRDGYTSMQVLDLKEEIKAQTEEAIERILKQGKAYKPRKDLIKLTESPKYSGGLG